jgi:hypothetical protein
LFWLNWVLNSIVFIMVFNLSRIVTWFQTRTWKFGNPVLTVFLPLTLALALTVVDSLRLYFVYQLIILVVTGGLLYWLTYKTKKDRW